MSVSSCVIETNPEFFNIKEVWQSKKLNHIRNLHKNGKRLELKNGCRNCRHGTKKYGATFVPTDWDSKSMQWKGHDFKHG